MNKLLVVLFLSAVVAVAMAATKQEMMAKKLAFKGKGKTDAKQDFLDEIQKLKQLDISPEELTKRIAQLKSKGTAAKKVAAKTEDADAILHKKKISEEIAKAKVELAAAEKEFRLDSSRVRSEANVSVKDKQRKMISMKQDFMAKVSDLKERMGFDTKRTDRMAWKHAQMKKQEASIVH